MCSNRAAQGGLCCSKGTIGTDKPLIVYCPIFSFQLFLFVSEAKPGYQYTSHQEKDKLFNTVGGGGRGSGACGQMNGMNGLKAINSIES